jgi:hypothetical protein
VESELVLDGLGAIFTATAHEGGTNTVVWFTEDFDAINDEPGAVLARDGDRYFLFLDLGVFRGGSFLGQAYRVIANLNYPCAAATGETGGSSPPVLPYILSRGTPAAIPYQRDTSSVATGRQTPIPCGTLPATSRSKRFDVQDGGTIVLRVVDDQGRRPLLGAFVGPPFNRSYVDCGPGEVIFSAAAGQTFWIDIDSVTVNLSMTKEYIDGARPADVTDFNNDARPDILLQDNQGTLAAWSMNGATLSSSSFLSPSRLTDPRWLAVATGRFNNDSSADILFQHADGSLAVWQMQGLALQTPVFLNPRRPSAPGWNAVATADFNKDTRPDILLQHTDGSLAIWFMNGVTLSLSDYVDPRRPRDVRWRAVGAGDFDGDGNVDIVLQHAEGHLGVWLLLDRRLIGSPMLTPSSTGNHDWRVVGATDLNQDAKPDLLLQHSRTGEMGVWFMNRLTRSSATLLNPARVRGWRIAAP